MLDEMIAAAAVTAAQVVAVPAAVAAVLKLLQSTLQITAISFCLLINN
jgi:hypothetical protein